MYLDALAAEIRAEVPDAVLPAEGNEGLFLYYAVLALAKGAGVEASDVHNAWVAWMLGRGERHESMVPFDRLSLNVQEEDRPFVEAIRRVAARRSR